VSRLDYLRPFAQASAEALAVFDVNSEETSAKFVRIGEILRSQKFHTEASMFFDAAFQKDRGSRDYLLAKLIEQFKVGVDMLESDLVALEQLDSGFHRYLRTELFRRANPDDHAGILTTAGNAHESFMSGSPADWIYIRAGIAVSGAAGHGREPSGKANLIPRRLFFYWDKDPPEEVVANFTYHQDNPDVETIVYTKEMSEDFLLQYYGKQARDLFLTLRHPAEESDFIRYHLIHTFGG